MRRVAEWMFAAALVMAPPLLSNAFAATPQIHTVVIEGMAFAPSTLTVNRGERVLWVNRDLFPHTATAQDRAFDSGEIGAGKSWTYVGSRAGRFDYVCTLHPGMRGTLVVR